jgi:hypothetical protein
MDVTCDWLCWITMILACMLVGLKSLMISLDYQNYMGSSVRIWSLRWLFLYLCSYNLDGSVTAINGGNCNSYPSFNHSMQNSRKMGRRVVQSNGWIKPYVHIFCIRLFRWKPHVLTTKSLRTSPRTRLKWLGILHDISLHTKDADLSLDFHVFEIPDFDIMIGHPLEKLFVGIPLLGKMDL